VPIGAAEQAAEVTMILLDGDGTVPETAT